MLASVRARVRAPQFRGPEWTLNKKILEDFCFQIQMTIGTLGLVLGSLQWAGIMDSPLYHLALVINVIAMVVTLITIYVEPNKRWWEHFEFVTVLLGFAFMMLMVSVDEVKNQYTVEFLGIRTGTGQALYVGQSWAILGFYITFYNLILDRSTGFVSIKFAWRQIRKVVRLLIRGLNAFYAWSHPSEPATEKAVKPAAKKPAKNAGEKKSPFSFLKRGSKEAPVETKKERAPRAPRSPRESRPTTSHDRLEVQVVEDESKPVTFNNPRSPFYREPKETVEAVEEKAAETKVVVEERSAEVEETTAAVVSTPEPKPTPRPTEYSQPRPGQQSNRTTEKIGVLEAVNAGSSYAAKIKAAIARTISYKRYAFDRVMHDFDWWESLANQIKESKSDRGYDLTLVDKLLQELKNLEDQSVRDAFAELVENNK